MINRPAVANTDKAKPGSRDCHGSIATTAAIAKPSAGSESPRCRVDMAISITAAIAAARNTDGDGRTSAMKQAKAIAVENSRAGILRKMNCMHQRTKAETMAKFAPLTAVKWVSPALRISFLKAALCFAVSPITMPGMSAPASPPPLAFRKPVRIAARDFAHREGGANSLIGAVAMSRAATLRSELFTIRPVIEIFCPGNNPWEDAFDAITRMGPY